MCWVLKDKPVGGTSINRVGWLALARSRPIAPALEDNRAEGTPFLGSAATAEAECRARKAPPAPISNPAEGAAFLAGF
jgi:hypothetical protein